MNKEEVIRGINSERYVGLTTYEDEAYNRGLDIALCYINQIDEPVKPPEPEPWKSEKPTIPQYVADWIEDNREALEEYVYSDAQIVLPRIQDDNPMYSWLNGKGIGIIVDCIRNGYEVEKEKLYTVELPNPNRTDVSLVLGLYNDGKVSIFAVFTDSWKYEKQYKLTEAEIKKDFEWAWQFAKEVEE